jgi:hypothetical protein
VASQAGPEHDDAKRELIAAHLADITEREELEAAEKEAKRRQMEQAMKVRAGFSCRACQAPVPTGVQRKAKVVP